MTFVTLEHFNNFSRDVFNYFRAIHTDIQSSTRHNDIIRRLAALQNDVAELQQRRTIEIQDVSTVTEQLETLQATVSALELVPTRATTSTAPPPELAPRTFFTHLPSALEASNTLLSNVPGIRFPVAVGTLPLEELYGQLHALHANSLEWLMAIDSRAQAIVSSFRDLPNLASFHRHDNELAASANRLIHMVQELVDRPQTPTPALQPLLDEVRALREDFSRHTPAAALEALAQALTNVQSQRPQAPLPELPVYTATHPSDRCRTHGVLVFDNIHTRIPMDILGSSPSTSLELRIAITRLPNETSVEFALYDADALLLSHSLQTPHRLANLPGDALALLHSHCPRFVYKLNRAGLC